VINRDAPVINPLITGRLRKPARKPSLSIPHRNNTTPAISAIWPASTTLRADPGGARAASAVPVISEVMAIGPTD
jgi:hypothetical protein